MSTMAGVINGMLVGEVVDPPDPARVTKATLRSVTRWMEGALPRRAAEERLLELRSGCRPGPAGDARRVGAPLAEESRTRARLWETPRSDRAGRIPSGDRGAPGVGRWSHRLTCPTPSSVSPPRRAHTYRGEAFRHMAAHRDLPLSREGARIYGGRFNPPDSFLAETWLSPVDLGSA